MSKLKPSVVLAFLLVAAAALAGSYYTATITDTGNGGSGVTMANPSSASDGIAISGSGYFTGPVANQCQVTIRTDAGTLNYFQDDAKPKNGQWMRGWKYSSDPAAPTSFLWSRAPWLDWSVTSALDAGTGTIVSIAINSLVSPPLPLKSSVTSGTVDPATTRYDWTAENIEEDGGNGNALDAGIFVLLECYTN